MLHKKVFLAIAIVLLSGCTAFSLLFDRLGWLTSWQLDRMFELRAEQELLVEEGSEAMREWFVVEGFPLLINRLETSVALWKQENYLQARVHLEQSLEQSIQAFLLAVRPHVMPLLLSLDEANTAHYRVYNEARKEDWFEHTLSQEAKVDKRIERLEDWFGNLNRDQRARVAELVALLPYERDIRLRNNDHWKERFLEAALSRDEAALEAWIAEPSLWWLPEYAQLRADNREQTRALVDMMIASMHQTQSNHVVNRVQDWIETLEDVL